MTADPLPGMPVTPPSVLPAARPDRVEPLPPRPATTKDTYEMTKALVRRFSALSPGNGPRYVIATEVRNRAGFAATRSCDAIVVDTWPSSGLAIHGFEVKVSRSDWLRELADPLKAEAFRRYCDRWWLAVGDPSIVRPGELPEGWGLMTYCMAKRPSRWDPVQRGYFPQPPAGSLRVAVAAPKLKPEPMPRTMLVPLLRAVANRKAASS